MSTSLATSPLLNCLEYPSTPPRKQNDFVYDPSTPVKNPLNPRKSFLSPVKKDFKENPLKKESLNNSNIVIYKSNETLLIMAVGQIVLKWCNCQSNSNEFKIHCDDVGKLPGVLPILYGKIGYFSLRRIFGATEAEYPALESLRLRINKIAGAKVLDENFRFAGKETWQTLMIYPRMDGNLEDLIPQLRLKGREDLIEGILDWVKKAIEDVMSCKVAHRDLRPRNIFYKVHDLFIKIFLADFGEAKRQDMENSPPEYEAFKRAVQTIKPARKNDPKWKDSLIKWEKLELLSYSSKILKDWNMTGGVVRNKAKRLRTGDFSLQS